jgi:LmeA-like phospholipid-binding
MRRLVIALLVLVGLFVAVDYGAAALAESAVSRQMREQIGLVDDPSVRINGFPFLTQAISGQYSSVDVDATHIRVGQLQELGVRAQLRDVSAPLPMLLGSGPKSLSVKAVEGVVQIPASDVQRLVPGIEKLRIENVDEYALEQVVVDEGADKSLRTIEPENAVRLVGTATILGEQSEVSVIAVLELVDGQAQITPRDVRLGGSDADPLPAAVQRTLQQQFTLRIDPGSLPLAATPTKLRAVGGSLEISGYADDLTLGDAAVSATG